MLSVVTITRNDLAGLRRTVDSASQLRGAWEHIVVDANSTDGTKEYLRSREDCLRYISEPDDGRYDGMNKGAELASGDLVWFMHSGDEFADPEKAMALVRLVEESGAAWGYGLSRVMRNGSAVAVGGDVSFSQEKFLLGLSIIPHQASIVRRDVFERLGGFSLEFGLAEDQHFFVRMLEFGLPVVLPDFVCVFDGWGAGSSRPQWMHFADMARSRHQEGVLATRSKGVDLAATGALIGKSLVKRSIQRVVR